MNRSFFAEVHCVKYRIRWENKNFDVTGTLREVPTFFSAHTVWAACKEQHIVFKIIQLLPYSATLYELQASCHAGRRRPTFGANQMLGDKAFSIISFRLQSDIVFAIVFPFSWNFNAISSEKSGLISMPFLLAYIDVRTVMFFPTAESWLVNSNLDSRLIILEKLMATPVGTSLVKRQSGTERWQRACAPTWDNSQANPQFFCGFQILWLRATFSKFSLSGKTRFYLVGTVLYEPETPHSR